MTFRRMLMNFVPVDGGGQGGTPPVGNPPVPIPPGLAGGSPPAPVQVPQGYAGGYVPVPVPGVQAPPAPPAQAPGFQGQGQTWGQAVPPPGVRMVPETEFNSLIQDRAELGTIKSGQTAAQAQAAADEIARKAKAGDWEQAYHRHKETTDGQIKSLNERLATQTAAFAATSKTNEIQAAIGRRTDLIPGAAEHLLVRLENDPELQVLESGGRFVVQTRDFRTVEARLNDLLVRPEFRMFLRPSGGGGTGTPGILGAGQGQPQTPQYGSMGEYLLAAAKAARGVEVQAGNVNRLGYGVMDPARN